MFLWSSCKIPAKSCKIPQDPTRSHRILQDLARAFLLGCYTTTTPIGWRWSTKWWQRFCSQVDTDKINGLKWGIFKLQCHRMLPNPYLTSPVCHLVICNWYLVHATTALDHPDNHDWVTALGLRDKPHSSKFN